jgi:hypothetical protein
MPEQTIWRPLDVTDLDNHFGPHPLDFSVSTRRGRASIATRRSPGSASRTRRSPSDEKLRSRAWVISIEPPFTTLAEIVGLLVSKRAFSSQDPRWQRDHAMNNRRRLERNRKFVDSPLEGSGFELTVPHRSSSNRGPRVLRRFEEIANFLSNFRSNDS